MSINHRSIIRTAVCGLLLVLLTAPVRSQIPRTISFQGVLSDGSGILVPDGQHSLTVTLYESSTAGTPLFSERQMVQVTRGVFDMIIGAATTGGIPASLPFDRQYWLGVQVDDGAELAGRTQLTAVPYALNAAHARNADTAMRALVADTAAHASIAASVANGYVVSVNGAQGALELLGSGATTVTRIGNQLIFRSSDTSGGGIRRLENLDGSLVIDPPQGPYTTAYVRAQGVQTHHLRDLSITNGKIIDNAVDARTIDTRLAPFHTALMSTGVATPMWLNPIHVNLAFHDAMRSDSTLWMLTNTGGGGAGDFVVASPMSSATALSGMTDGRGIAVSALATGSGTGLSAMSSTGVTGRFQNVGGGYAVQAIGTYDAQEPTMYVSRLRLSEPTLVPDNNVLRSATVDAFNQWPDGVGVSGRAQDGTGLSGYTETGTAVRGWSAGSGLAGLFVGDVELRSGTVTADTLTVSVLNCTGSLSKPAGTFKIDHPLDPANRYLYHSFVESDEMMNIYNGVVTLDERGEAVVLLPEWFEALNRDFRYQLTPIGAAAPNLHVSQEVGNLRFGIAGGAPGLRVSWQVTGVRHDPYAEDHRVKVEVEKPAAERGTFAYPQGYSNTRPGTSAPALSDGATDR